MFTKRHTRQRLVVAGLTLAAVLVGALLLRTEFLDTTLQSIVYDEAIAIGNPPIANQVTIVALDDQTVDQYRLSAAAPGLHGPAASAQAAEPERRRVRHRLLRRRPEPRRGSRARRGDARRRQRHPRDAGHRRGGDR